jgi:hypothetical protein
MHKSSCCTVCDVDLLDYHFSKNRHTTEHILFETMQEVRRMKNSPLSTEEIQRVEEVFVLVSAAYLLLPLGLLLFTFSLFCTAYAGAQDIQK